MVKIDHKNPLFTSCSNVKEMCFSFFGNSPIMFFEYAKFLANGKVILLSTHPEFTNLIFANGLNFTKDQLNQINRYSLLNSNYIPGNFEFKKYDMLTNLSRINFKIDHFFTISISNNAEHELFSFGANANSGLAMDFYVNNINFLEKFTLYFKEQATSLWSEYQKKNIIILTNFNTISNERNIPTQGENHYNIHAFTPDYDNLLLHSKEYQLSKREKECLCLTVQGYSAKEVAKTLAISHRTVEAYIENLKIKLGITKKSALWKVLSRGVTTDC